MTQRKDLPILPRPLSFTTWGEECLSSDGFFPLQIGFRKPSARFGDWYGFEESCGKATKTWVFYHSSKPGSCALGYKTQLHQSFLLNFTGAEDTERAMTVDLSAVQCWQELRPAEKIQLNYDPRSELKQVVKLNDTHVLLLVNKFTKDDPSQPCLTSVSIDSGFVSEIPVPGAEYVAAIPSQDEKKQNRVVVTTLNKIHSYELVDKKSVPAKQFQPINTTRFVHGGPLFFSSNGQYCVASAHIAGGVAPKLCSVSADGQFTTIVEFDLGSRIFGWFAEHFLYAAEYQYSDGRGPLLATHPITLDTYLVASNSSENTCILGNRLTNLNRVEGSVTYFEEILYTVDEFVTTFTGITPIPAPVARVVFDYLMARQIMFPKPIFEPVIPDSLPRSLHQDARKLQWEFKSNKVTLDLLQDIFKKLPTFQLNGKDSIKNWLKQFDLRRMGDKGCAKVKTFFDAVAQEMEKVKEHRHS